MTGDQTRGQGTPSQAALAIAQLRVNRLFTSRWTGWRLLDEQALLGLELDAVLLGADPRPPLTQAETQYRRSLRQQKEADEAAVRKQEEQQARQAQVVRTYAAWEEECRAGKAERAAREAQRAAEARERAAQKEQREARVQRALAERWATQAIERWAFEMRFSSEFMKIMRGLNWEFDLCPVCDAPFWITRANLINWDIYWKEQPRCPNCYCPPLTELIRSENPTWSPARVSHEVITAIFRSGKYAKTPELVALCGG
jgi:hypothetical protein